MTSKDLLIAALVDLYRNGPSSEIFGICYHVQEYMEDLYAEEGEIEDLMDELFQRWPEFSGSVTYPVPGPKGQSPSAAFCTGNMWSGSYGAKRWALAEFMLRELCK